MLGFKIDVLNQTITPVTISDKHVLDDLKLEIECDYIDRVNVHDLDFWVDDESLLKTPQAHTFLIHGYGLITGNAVVLSHDGGGKSIDAATDLKKLQSLITFTGEITREPSMVFMPL